MRSTFRGIALSAALAFVLVPSASIAVSTKDASAAGVHSDNSIVNV